MFGLKMMRGAKRLPSGYVYLTVNGQRMTYNGLYFIQKVA